MSGPSGKAEPLETRQDLLAHLLDPNLRSRVPNYLFQCGLATACLVVILLVEDAVLQAAIVVAVAFILLSALALSIIRAVLRPKLINLI